MKVRGYAAQSADSPLAPWEFERRSPGQKDVRIQIEHCGICHSDIHFARNEWQFTSYPCVPGTRDRGPRRRGRQRRHPASSGRPGRCRLLRRLLPDLRELQGWTGELLRDRPPDDLRQLRSGREDPDLRRLLDADRRGRGLRPQDPGVPRSGRSRAAPVRGHHDLLPASPRRRVQGHARRGDGPGRPRPHGRQARGVLRRGGHRPESLRRRRRPMRSASGRTTSCSRAGPTRSARSPDASTSSSIPCRRSTT